MHIYIYMYIYIYTYVYMYMYIYIYIEREREIARLKAEPNLGRRQLHEGRDEEPEADA